MSEPGFGKSPPPDQGRRLFRVTGVKLRAWPIAFAILLAFGIPLVGEIAVLVVQHFVPLPDLPLYPWMERYYESGAQLLLALIAITFMKGFLRADFGMHRPRDESYVTPALFLGVLLGLLTAAVDHWPEIAAHHAPSGAFELTPVNIAGSLSYQGFFLGLSDETLYRGLLVTYLAAMIPGRVTFLRFDIGIAGVIVALIVAMTFLGGFVAYPFGTALARMLVAFVQGLFFAYWFEKSKSLFAPVVGHGACFGIYQILVFAMVAAWG
jgi:uncharacterized protein